MPNSVPITASRSGCVWRNAKLGYGTLSYTFEPEDMVATLSLFPSFLHLVSVTQQNRLERSKVPVLHCSTAGFFYAKYPSNTPRHRRAAFAQPRFDVPSPSLWNSKTRTLEAARLCSELNAAF